MQGEKFFARISRKEKDGVFVDLGNDTEAFLPVDEILGASSFERNRALTALAVDMPITVVVDGVCSRDGRTIHRASEKAALAAAISEHERTTRFQSIH